LGIPILIKRQTAFYLAINLLGIRVFSRRLSYNKMKWKILGVRFWKYTDIYKFNCFSAGFKQYREGKYTIVTNDKLKIETNSSAGGQLGSIYEVLGSGSYDLSINKPYIMFDIGLNIGVTSLYFAQNDNIKKIYAFEPFTPTRLLAQRNLELNPKLAEKIQVFDFGLGKEEKDLEIAYNPHAPYNMSTTLDLFQNVKLKKVQSSLENVVIKKTSEIFSPLLEKKGAHKVFCKIDCEGAEFEILEDLDQAGLLSQIDVIIMEWHFRVPDVLIDLLEKNNFVCFFTTLFYANNIGIIRAVRTTF
jgi:FkbM family methyltransferase